MRKNERGRLESSWSPQIQEFEATLMSPEFKRRMGSLFAGYYGNTFDNIPNLTHYFLRNAAAFEQLKLSNKRVLDVGAGFGTKLVCFSLMGTMEGVGIERDEDMMRGFLDLTSFFPKLKVRPKKGDIHNYDFGSDVFDVIVLENAISHIRDTELLLRRLHKLLAPEGVLYVSDDNNRLFFPSSLGRWRSHREAEFGSSSSIRAKRSREVDLVPFRDVRKRMIRDRFPEINERELNQLAARTQGMYGDEVIEAVSAYRTSGTMPRRPTFRYRNPMTGEFAEKDFDPLNLLGVLEENGFNCRIVRPLESYLLQTNPRLPRHLSAVSKVLTILARESPMYVLPFVYPSFTIAASRE